MTELQQDVDDAKSAKAPGKRESRAGAAHPDVSSNQMRWQTSGL